MLKNNIVKISLWISWVVDIIFGLKRNIMVRINLYLLGQSLIKCIKIRQVQIVANICIIINGIKEFVFVKRKFMESIIGIMGGLYIPSWTKPFSPLKL